MNSIDQEELSFFIVPCKSMWLKVLPFDNQHHNFILTREDSDPYDFYHHWKL
jgi:hypothetical protein